MSDPFYGEIRMFAGTFAPRGWAFCNGQLLQVSQNQALFSLLGTTYGGDGRTTFALPDLRGRIPLHQGTGLGLTERRLGSKGGSQTEILTVNQLPSHQHTPRGSSDLASSNSPSGTVVAKRNNNFYKTNPDPTKVVTFPSTVVGNTGGSQSHTNLQPVTGINFIICLVGSFPSRQ